MKKGVLKDQPILLVIYSAILILLLSILILMIVFGSVIGKSGYFMHMIFSMFCIILGLPLFLFVFLLLLMTMGDLIRDILLYKRKLFTSKEQSLKDDLFMIGATFIVTSILFGITFIGVKEGKKIINDYSYTKSPKNVILYECNIEYQSGWHNILGGKYKLHGIDRDGNPVEFLIGKNPPNLSKNATLSIDYLPHLGMIWNMESYLR